MDEEEKELLKKVLAKVEKLEEGLKEKDKEIAKLHQERPSSPPSFDNVKDPLARAIIIGAMRKQESLKENTGTVQPTLNELKEHHLGELILFAKKKGIPLGNQERENEGEVKVYLD